MSAVSDTFQFAQVAALVGHVRSLRRAAFGAPALVRHLRRRAASHNRYSSKRRPNIRLAAAYNTKRRVEDGGGGSSHASQRPTSRVMRRKLALLSLSHAPPETLDSNLEGSADACVPSRSWRLESHIWHSRRMRMEQRWGVTLAAGLVGHGRGSRSFLHHVRHGLVMHDASYWACLCIQGTLEAMSSGLRLISDPDLVDRQLGREEVVLGAVEWALQLHRPGLFPAAAIGPVKAMLVPATQASSGCAGGGEGDSRDLALWVWVHVAAAQEVRDALEQACILAGLPGRPRLLPLRRIELLGPGSEAALLSTLLPVDNSVSIPSEATVAHGQAIAARIWSSVRLQRAGLGPAHRKQWTWPPGCSLGMEAIDPRLAAPLRAGGLGLDLPGIPLQAEPLSPGQLGQQRRGWPGTGAWARGAGDLLPVDAISSAPAAAARPLNCHQVSELRSGARKAALALGPLPPSSDLARPSPASQPTTPSFPLLLVRRSYVPAGKGHGALAAGWSLILPAGWVMPVWSALAFKGARPCGQREWRWAAALAQAPCFPYDYPHTAAGAAWLDGVRRSDLAAASRRPLGRARRVPAAAAYAAWATGLGRELAVAASADGSGVVVEDEGVVLPLPKGGKGGSAAKRGKGGKASGGTAAEGTASAAGHLVVSFCGGSWTGTAARPTVLINAAGPAPRPMTGSGGTGPGGRLTRVEAKCRRLLERALRASGGLVSGSPGAASMSAPLPKAPLLPGNGGAVQHSGPTAAHPGVMAYASVRIRGRGRCEEGAAVLMSSSLPGSAAPTVPILNPAAGSAASVAAAPPHVAALPAAAARLRVVGYITSGYPRGMPGSLYPGGTALCIASYLHAEVPSAPVSAGGRHVCWVLNPDSNALRRAEIRLIPSCCHEAAVITV